MELQSTPVDYVKESPKQAQLDLLCKIPGAKKCGFFGEKIKVNLVARMGSKQMTVLGSAGC